MEARTPILPSSITATIDMNIPIEWEFKDVTECKVRVKMKLANRFIKKLARLCARFGYRTEIEIRGSEENKNAAE